MVLHAFTNHTNGARTLRVNLSTSSVIARNLKDGAVYRVLIDVRIPSCCVGVLLQNCAAQRVSSNAVDLPVHERDNGVADLGFNDRQSVEETLSSGFESILFELFRVRILEMRPADVLAVASIQYRIPTVTTTNRVWIPLVGT
jgi:NMD protein affecting ribosome stability and mRNA decay